MRYYSRDHVGIKGSSELDREREREKKRGIERVGEEIWDAVAKCNFFPFS